jgi:hypothetical protein
LSSIIKGSGVTPSEKYLAHLAEKTFLNLWSYPNVFIDKKQNGRGVGKELCDLLIVCGRNVFVFSDKHVGWPYGDVHVAWQRWFKRAIKKSVDQIRGAERWIQQFPDRIFSDPECTCRLPIQLPRPEEIELHGIVVANGAMRACQEYFGRSPGTLLIRSALRDEDHINPRAAKYLPFTIGDVDTGGAYIHVVNEVTLDIAMKELDTVTDLAQYLSKKALFIRSGRLLQAEGEEDLIAYFMTHMDGDEHGFPHPNGRPWSVGDHVTIAGKFKNLINNRQYDAKREADKVSYVWDRLIEVFTTPMMDGTTIVPEGRQFALSTYEVAVRHMALENRFRRRILGNAILEAMEEGRQTDRFVRIMVAPEMSQQCETGYFFMTLKCPQDFGTSEEGYQRYRVGRRNMLEAYAYAVMKRYHYLERIIGIGVEPPPSPEDPKGSSEDLVMLEKVTWTAELEKKLEERCKLYSILQKPPRESRPSGEEWPND